MAASNFWDNKKRSAHVITILNNEKKILSDVKNLLDETKDFLEMAKTIAEFTGSDLGVGITGRLTSNLDEEKGAHLCLYDRRYDKIYTTHIVITKTTRKENKLEVIDAFIQLFNSTIKA